MYNKNSFNMEQTAHECSKSPNGFPFSKSCFLVPWEVSAWERWRSPRAQGGGRRASLDAGQLVPQAGGEDALHLLHDEV